MLTIALAVLGGGRALQYINFEEGRIRPVQALSQTNGYDGVLIDGNMNLPNGKRGAYDYYIRDYQANVRMILTEETHYSYGFATMETERAADEEPVFGQTGSGNEVLTTRFAKPSGWNSNSTASVSKLSKAIGKTIGSNSLLKVMAGDAINASTFYYYEGGTSNNSGNSLATDVINSFVGALSGGTATVGSALHNNTVATTVTSSLSTPPFTSIADPHRYSGDNNRRAYLNILFFDERFNFVSDGSTYQRVQNTGDNAAPLVLANIKAPKNGYAYVYVSNESDEPVYFDNVQVALSRGRIIEENHYYAYGLKIAGISSHKLADANEGHVDNKNLYNDKELDDEGDLNWLDYGFRNYDPQIGRFVQIDPLTDEMPDMSGYHYAYNDPITNIDEDGLAGIGSILAQVACQNSGGILQGLGTFLGHLGTAICSVSNLALTIGATAGKIAGDVSKKVDKDSKIGNQVGDPIKNNTKKGLIGGPSTAALEGTKRAASKVIETTIIEESGSTFVLILTRFVLTGAAVILPTYNGVI